MTRIKRVLHCQERRLFRCCCDQPQTDIASSEAELRAAISPQTRSILLNTPHNPTGKVFTREEITFISSLAIEHDLMVITDEVYEHLIFDGREHVSMAGLPECVSEPSPFRREERRLTRRAGRSGGFRPRELLRAAMSAKQFLTYVNGAPFQPAIAAGLRLGDDYFNQLCSRLADTRDRLGAGLLWKFNVFPSEATYSQLLTSPRYDPMVTVSPSAPNFPTNRRGGNSELGVLRQPRARPKFARLRG